MVENEIRQQLFPGIEILLAKGERIIFHQAYGKIDRNPDAPDLAAGSIFDLASLTKPLATAAAVIHLADHKRLNLDGLAVDIIPEFRDSEKSDITIVQLLTHSSGFIDWLPLYDPDFDKKLAWERLIRSPMRHTPGTAVLYSCLGYIVLGEIVRRTSGLPLNTYCQSHLFRPLGLKTLQFNPQPDAVEIVPTAYCPMRKRYLKGIVHDENAYVFCGEGGNAGLFGSAPEIHAYCLMLLSSGIMNGIRILSETAVRKLLTNQNPSRIPERTCGWDVNDGGETEMSCGSLMPLGSVGHLGFTGTSIWMDPASGIMIVLLANRVNFSREGNIPRMRIFRPKIHTLLLSFIL